MNEVMARPVREKRALAVAWKTMHAFLGVVGWFLGWFFENATDN